MSENHFSSKLSSSQLTMYRRLKKVGFTEQQAELLTEIFFELYQINLAKK